MIRADTSGGPPGPNGTMSLMGRSGNPAAFAAHATLSKREPAAARVANVRVQARKPPNRACERLIRILPEWHYLRERNIAVANGVNNDDRRGPALRLFVHCAKGPHV